MVGYTYDDLQHQLTDILQKTTTFSVFGTIGSRDVTRDVDIISIKTPEATGRNYLKEIHTVLDNLDEHLRTTYDKKLVRFNRFSQEDTVKHIGKYEQGDLALHMMNYRSLPELEQMWQSDMIQGEPPQEILTDPKYKFHTIHGDRKEALKNTQKLSHSGIYQYLERRDRTHSNFPDELLLKSHNELFYYLTKRLGLEEQPVAHTKEESREHMYRLADEIEKREQ